MKNLSRTIIIIIITFFYFQNCKKNNSLRIENERESGSTITIRNFTRDSFNTKGVLVWKIRSEEAFVYLKENKSIFYKLDFDQFEKGKIKSELKSDRGEINHQTKKLTLNGNIHLITDDKKHLKTEELNYDLNEEKLNTDKEVLILMKGTTIRGLGLEADKGLNSIKILKPIGNSTENPVNK